MNFKNLKIKKEKIYHVSCSCSSGTIRMDINEAVPISKHRCTDCKGKFTVNKTEIETIDLIKKKSSIKEVQ